MRRAASLLVLTALGCTSARVASHESSVVYGTDDRVEVYAATSAVHRAIAENAIGMKVDATLVDASRPDDVRITYTTTLGEAEMLCPGEPFADQVEPGDCSGTLIDARHLLTAGHCVEGPGGCDATAVWVLGYRYDAPGVLATLTTDDVFGCARIVAYQDDASADYAVIELDRDATGHTPASVARTRPLPDGTSLTLIGHPDGIAMKIAPNGVVNGTLGASFTATVDAFAGNSGSGAFDDAGHLVGILDSGNDDYVARGSCFVVNVLDPSGGDGETLTYADEAIGAFCATGIRSPVCDGADAGVSTDAALGMEDAGVTDAAAGDAATSDATAAADASSAHAPSGGCGCRAGRAPSSALSLAILALAWVATRARRR